MTSQWGQVRHRHHRVRDARVSRECGDMGGAVIWGGNMGDGCGGGESEGVCGGVNRCWSMDRGGQVLGVSSIARVARVGRELGLGDVSRTGEVRIGVASMASIACPPSQAIGPIDPRARVTLTAKSAKSAVSMDSVEGVSTCLSLSIGLASCPRNVKQNAKEGNLEIVMMSVGNSPLDDSEIVAKNKS